MSNEKGFFDTPEFRNLLKRYEQMRHDSTSAYFDISELGDLLSYYITNNNLSEGEEVYNLAQHLHNICDETLRMKGRLLLAQGYPQNALDTVARLGNDNESLILKADILLALKQYKESRIAARKILQNSIATDEIAYDALEILLDCGFAQEVQEYTINALRNYPGHQGMLEVLAEAYIEQQKIDSAIEIYNNLLDDNPYSTFYWEQLGHIYYMIGRYGKAIECFEYELTIESNIEYAIMMQGFCYYKLRDYKKSIEIFTTLQEKYPSSIIPRFYIALSHSNLNNHSEALKEYNKILESDNQKQEYKIGAMLALINQAIIYYRQGETETAIKCIYNALKQETPTDDMKQLIITGSPYYELKYKENMIFDEINSTEIKEWASYELLFALGLSMIKTGYKELALMPLIKAHSIAPDHTEIDAHIAYILHSLNKNNTLKESMINSALEGKSNKLFELFNIPYNAYITLGEFLQIIDNRTKN